MLYQTKINKTPEAEYLVTVFIGVVHAVASVKNTLGIHLCLLFVNLHYLGTLLEQIVATVGRKIV
jgi:hypothetical protein